MWCDWRAGIRGSHFKGAIFCQLAHLVGRRPKTKEILFNAQKLWRRWWWWSSYGILQSWIAENGESLENMENMEKMKNMENMEKMILDQLKIGERQAM